jgi:hypothetical protein
MTAYQAAIKRATVAGRGLGEGVILRDYGGEQNVDFTAALNYTYDVDLTNGIIQVTPATGFIAGDSFQLVDSRFLCGPAAIIRVKFSAVPGYLFCGALRDCDLQEPGVSSVFEYRSATIGFVRI